jgi:CRP-like cAMP-binding protein
MGNLMIEPYAALVRIFEAEPDLVSGLQPEMAQRLRRQVLAELVTIPVGPWDPAPLEARSPFGVMVLEGLIVSAVTLAGRRGLELVGPGDLIRPWGHDSAVASVPYDVTWSVVSPTWVALCDSDFERIAVRCPELMRELIGRTMRYRSVAMSRALLQIPNLENRLLVFMWQLADRWGRIKPGKGVVIELQLSQSTLGDLIGARRQSISRAMCSLMRRGLVSRKDGHLILHGGPPDAPDEPLGSYGPAEPALAPALA